MATGSGIPTPRSHRGARHGRRRRHVLADSRICCALGARCARTRTGAAQLARIVGGRVEVFDLPWWHGPVRGAPSAQRHLASRGRPRTRFTGRCCQLASLSCSMSWMFARLPCRRTSSRRWAATSLAVRPGVVIVAEGNPQTCAALAAAGCEVHTLDLSEIGLNGSGGPTCLTRPVLRVTTGLQA